jgi:hypothetical protein
MTFHQRFRFPEANEPMDDPIENVVSDLALVGLIIKGCTALSTLVLLVAIVWRVFH